MKYFLPGESLTRGLDDMLQNSENIKDITGKTKYIIKYFIIYLGINR